MQTHTDTGTLAMSDNGLSWTKTRDCTIVQRGYVVREMKKRLAGGLFREMSIAARQRVVDVITSEGWLKFRNGMTVGAMVRDAKDVALMEWIRDRTR